MASSPKHEIRRQNVTMSQILDVQIYLGTELEMK